MRARLLALAFLTLGCSDAAPEWFCEQPLWPETSLGPQKAVVARSPETTATPVLAIFLHGDAPRDPPSYQYAFARRLAAEADDVVAAAILRPGYTDPCGDTSAGDKGLAMGDNYSAANVAAIAETIRALQAEHRPRRTVVIGHSGGAALTALLAARHPGIADRSILLACPCVLDDWRRHMAERQESDLWLEPMGGISPLDSIADLPDDHPIDLIVGETDRVTPSGLSATYFVAAREAGKQASLTLLPDVSHSLTSDTDVWERVLQLLDTHD